MIPASECNHSLLIIRQIRLNSIHWVHREAVTWIAPLFCVMSVKSLIVKTTAKKKKVRAEQRLVNKTTHDSSVSINKQLVMWVSCGTGDSSPENIPQSGSRCYRTQEAKGNPVATHPCFWSSVSHKRRRFVLTLQSPTLHQVQGGKCLGHLSWVKNGDKTLTECSSGN